MKKKAKPKLPERPISLYHKVSTNDGFTFEFQLATPDDLFRIVKENPDATQVCMIRVVADATGIEGKYFRVYREPFAMAHHMNFIKKFMRDPVYRKTYHKSGVHWDGIRELKKADIIGDTQSNEEEPMTPVQEVQTEPVETEEPQIMLHPKCAEEIVLFNRMTDEELKSANFEKLKTYGIDGYSRLSVKAVEERIPKGILESIQSDERLGGTDYAKVLKWVARGLRPDIATTKILQGRG